MKLKIDVYSIEKCPYCDSSKKLLESKKLQFQEIKLSTEEAKQAFYNQHPGVRSMPQIFINDQRVGGFTGLQNALKTLNL